MQPNVHKAADICIDADFYQKKKLNDVIKVDEDGLVSKSPWFFLSIFF